MRIIAFIEDDEVIKKILKHLGLWEIKQRPPPKTVGPNVRIDTSDSQLPALEDYLYRDPQYPIEAYAS
jgi:hypothetical protein